MWTCYEVIDESYVNARTGHVSVSFQGFCIVWGGRSTTTPNPFLPSEELMVYAQDENLLHLHKTRGEIPPPRSHSSTVLVGSSLFTMSGFDQDVWSRTCRVWQLDLVNLIWTEIHPDGRPPLSCERVACWAYSSCLEGLQ